jgi:hypothetical protein
MLPQARPSASGKRCLPSVAQSAHFARHVCVVRSYARKRVVVWGGPKLEAQPAGDDEPLNLVRPLADLQDLLVSVQAGDCVLVHESVAAVDLQ